MFHFAAFTLERDALRHYLISRNLLKIASELCQILLAQSGESRSFFMKNIWILAGEASGDIYGARLAEELRQIAKEKNEEVSFTGMGGPRMIASGIPVKVDSTELGVVGIFEVTKMLFTFIGIYLKLVREAKKDRPDAVILIDYPGFNLLFALAMWKNNIKVVWYVCPHLWVWAKWRLPVLAKICSKMLVIFPFEVEVFEPTPLRAEFVGHPLIEIVSERMDPAIRRDPTKFLLLPGSRTHEVKSLLPTMLETIRCLAVEHPELSYHLSAPREKIAVLCREIYEKFRKKHADVPALSITVGDTAQWQQRAGTGIAASGTVTVESAISGLPLVVGYRMGWATVLVALVLVRLYRGFFTMVNIIAYKEVFPEFFQHRFSVKNLLPAVKAFLPGGSRRQQVESEMEEVKRLLSPQSSSAARQAALACWDAAEKTTTASGENQP